MKRTALVTGATGAIGPILVNELISLGYDVRVLIRENLKKNTLPNTILEFIGDINDKSVLSSALSGVDVVFHLAAKLHINTPDPSLEEEYYRVNVEGTKNIVMCSRDAGVKRIVLFSTISVYGSQNKNEDACESTLPNPQSFYAKTKLQSEEIVLNTSGKIPSSESIGVVLRLGAVYGHRMKGNYMKMVSAIKKGWFLPVGRGDNFRTLVYERDVVKAAVLSGEHPDAAGKIYNVTDGDIHTLDTILLYIYNALKKHKPALYIPVPPIRYMAVFLDIISGIVLGRGKKIVPMIEKLVENVAISGEKIEKELGFKPAYTLEKGWQETIDKLYPS